MEKRRRITEEDLRITEALMARSYSRLKQSVIQVPSRAYRSLGLTVQEHPYESAAAAVGVGAAGFGIINMLTSRASQGHGTLRVTIQKETGPDLMQEMLPILIPLVAPYISGYIQEYLGGIPSGNCD